MAGWRDSLIPAFEATHPNIKVEFTPTAAADYDAALQTRLAGDAAGDLIVCRPFDGSLALFKNGFLASLNDLPGLENFSDTAKAAWQTDDHSDTFCVPMGSVVHGFIYNADAFAQLGLKPPTTQDEFLQVLAAIKKDGRYAPLAQGTKESWVPGEMSYMAIGPNYWQGEKGRLALMDGTAKVTDQPYVDAFKAIAAWNPYLPSGHEAVDYAAGQNLFTLGKAAILPAGSWMIDALNKDATFNMGFFVPPVPTPGAPCYILKHPDEAMGMNAKTKHPAEAKQFLEWMTSAESASLFTTGFTGYFPLSTHDVAVTDPLAKAFLQGTKDCEPSIRLSYQILSRGTPSFTTELYRVSTAVEAGGMSPEAAAKELQDGLDTWFKP